MIHVTHNSPVVAVEYPLGHEAISEPKTIVEKFFKYRDENTNTFQCEYLGHWQDRHGVIWKAYFPKGPFDYQCVRLETPKKRHGMTIEYLLVFDGAISTLIKNQYTPVIKPTS